ncbi:hypothetical protein AV645_05415 [Acinetobacter calcoaceticus]|uniref:Uncharacterized protein n=1 Tax=Acinetobacter oleivorans TaxID=1148157 RepID=A0A0B2UDW7_9GAMM|nr:hypothetical protein [Acinetobacter calcoaceticus]KHN67479.1 hypothetical protein DH17_12490 [Acinetobacter oleivorans]KUM11114.1 hypothetical protein AV645_05415 [Acinetobacter calcoaceticus]
MENQDNSIINNFEAIESEVEQKKENSLLNPDPVEVTELIIEIGKNVVDFASSIFDNIDINF